jgi:hypothetical protein
MTKNIFIKIIKSFVQQQNSTSTTKIDENQVRKNDDLFLSVAFYKTYTFCRIASNRD